FGQADLVENLKHIGILGQTVDVEGRTDGGPEHEVLGKRRVVVVAVGIEALDQRCQLRIHEPVPQGGARLQDAFGDIGAELGVDRTTQAELEQVFGQVDGGQHVQHYLAGRAAVTDT